MIWRVTLRLSFSNGAAFSVTYNAEAPSERTAKERAKRAAWKMYPSRPRTRCTRIVRNRKAETLAVRP